MNRLLFQEKSIQSGSKQLLRNNLRKCMIRYEMDQVKFICPNPNNLRDELSQMHKIRTCNLNSNSLHHTFNEHSVPDGDSWDKIPPFQILLLRQCPLHLFVKNRFESLTFIQSLRCNFYSEKPNHSLIFPSSIEEMGLLPKGCIGDVGIYIY